MHDTSLAETAGLPIVDQTETTTNKTKPDELQTVREHFAILKAIGINKVATTEWEHHPAKWTDKLIMRNA